MRMRRVSVGVKKMAVPVKHEIAKISVLKVEKKEVDETNQCSLLWLNKMSCA